MKLLGHNFDEQITANYRTVRERIKDPYKARMMEVSASSDFILMEVAKDKQRFAIVLINESGIYIDTESIAKNPPRTCFMADPTALKKVTEKEWSEAFGTEETE